LKFIVLFFKRSGSNQPKKNGRATVKGKTVVNKRVKECTQKLSIEFFETRGGPIGPNSRAFIDEIVIFTRKWAPLIGVNSWKNIKDEVKERIVEGMLVCCVLIFIKCCCVH